MEAFEEPFDEGGVDGAGADAVDAELGGVIDGELAGHGEDGALGGAIGEAAFDAHLPGDGADVDYASVGGDQQRERGASDQIGAVDVDAKEAVEVGGRGFLDVADEADAGVVDEDVEFIERREDAGDIGFAGDVAGERGGAREFGGERGGAGGI